MLARADRYSSLEIFAPFEPELNMKTKILLLNLALNFMGFIKFRAYPEINSGRVKFYARQ